MKNKVIYTFKKIKHFLTVCIWLTVKKNLIEFCMTSTLHGLKHIVQKRVHFSERLFWAIITGIMVYCSIILGLTQMNRYMNNPTVVSIKKNFRDWNNKFPAITACFSDSSDITLVNQYLEDKWNVTEKHDKYIHYYEFVRLVATVSFRTDVRQFWKYENDENFQRIDLMSVVYAVAPKIMIKTTVHDSSYKPIWDLIITEMGICKTFNSIFSSYQSIRTWKTLDEKMDPYRDLKKRKLLECNYMNKKCFAKFNIMNTTAKYFIHSPYDIAEINSNPVETVEESEELDAVFRTSYIESAPEIRSLNVNQRKCKYPEEHISSTIPAYSNALCQMECRSRMAIAFCGCRPYFYIIGEGKPCDTKGMSCIGRNMEILINLPQNLAKCSCIPQCIETNYVIHKIKVSPWNSSIASIFDRETTAKYSLLMPKVIMYKNVIFTINDLIASFGGFGVLFFGISFISGVEIIMSIYNTVFNIYTKIRIYEYKQTS